MFNDDYNKIRGPSELFAAAPRRMIIAIILILALLAFEVFNFDTTKFALTDLLGEVSFLGISWAAILGFAFCAIDFAGLIRILTPEQGIDEPKEVWYLMGAWLLGATMNAIMTWYAVSLTLIQRPLGTNVLDPEQLRQIVPIFVAVFVWLTRILFIGSISVAGEQLFMAANEPRSASQPYRGQSAYSSAKQVNPGRPPQQAPQRSERIRPTTRPQNRPQPQTISRGETPSRTSRVRQRPPMPNRANQPAPMRAKPPERDY